MVYVIAELRNYRQLARLRADVLPAVEASLASVLGSPTSPPRSSVPGIWIAEGVPESELDAAAVADAAWRVRTVLAERRADLFGYAVLVASLASAGTDAERALRIERLLEQAEADEGLWITADCAALFSDSLVLQTSGALYRAEGPREGPASE